MTNEEKMLAVIRKYGMENSNTIRFCTLVEKGTKEMVEKEYQRLMA